MSRAGRDLATAGALRELLLPEERLPSDAEFELAPVRQDVLDALRRAERQRLAEDFELAPRVGRPAFVLAQLETRPPRLVRDGFDVPARLPLGTSSFSSFPERLDSAGDAVASLAREVPIAGIRAGLA